MQEHFQNLFKLINHFYLMGIQKSMQSLKAEEDNKVCPECGSKDIEKSKVEIYCNKCGFVISD